MKSKIVERKVKVPDYKPVFIITVIAMTLTSIIAICTAYSPHLPIPSAVEIRSMTIVIDGHEFFSCDAIGISKPRHLTDCAKCASLRRTER